MWKNRKKDLRTVLLGRRVGTGRDRRSAESSKRKPKQGYTRGNVRDVRPGAEEVGPGSQTEP